MQTYGGVVCSGTGCYQWTIYDFLSRVPTDYYTVTSPVFSYLDREYFMNLYMQKDKNMVGLYFHSRHLSLERLQVTLGMRTGDKGKREDRCGEIDDYGVFEVIDWMRYSEFMERISEILCNGKLMVFCQLRRLDEGESPASPLETPPSHEEVQEESDSEDVVTVLKLLEKLQSDFKNILDSGEDCDVTIKIHGKEFLAHRIILRARSPVFKSMFSHEMLEKQSGVVFIEDCDAATFPDFLNYLYTGSTRHVSDENVCQLYTASDKYQVEELKKACAAYMKKHLSVCNFCDILTLALRHSERELIGLSTEFFSANATEIANSTTWQTFLRENPTAGNELFLKYLSREKIQVKPCTCNSGKINKS